MIARLGIISDTHGLLRPEAECHLIGADHIVHTGDPSIIAALTRIAPVTAIRGNNDEAGWARAYPETKTTRFAGLSIFVLLRAARPECYPWETAGKGGRCRDFWALPYAQNRNGR